jgi:uncharacterized protein (DUF2062 family)
MRAWFKKKVADPFLHLLRQGVTPQKLAQCVAFGLVIAIFPALGWTTLLAGAAALRFKLNMVAIQTVNYLAYPLQFVLLIPFFRAGERLFHEPPLPLSAAEVTYMIKSAPLHAISQLWTVTWHAAVVWAMLACLAIPLLTLVLTPVFKKISSAQAAA